MKKSKQKKLEAAGWKVGSITDFLGLTQEEAALVEIKLELANQVKLLRINRNLSQIQFAKQIGSSQSRVAKMESADSSVSIDLLIRSLLALGATKADIGRVIGSDNRRRHSTNQSSK